MDSRWLKALWRVVLPLCTVGWVLALALPGGSASANTGSGNDSCSYASSTFTESTVMRSAQIDGTEDKDITIKFPSGAERKFTGQALLLNFCLPNFYFHYTTAYDILRHCGVEVGKRDFLGTPVTS